MKKYARSIFLILCAVFISCSSSGIEKSRTKKIIAMSPGIVETLFFLGSGNDIIGTAGHCSYPEAAKKIPVVGGISELNYEFVLTAKPDAVFLMPSQDHTAHKLDQLGIRSVTVPQESLEDILNSFVVIGKELGKEKRASVIKDSLGLVLNLYRKPADSLKVLISVGREYGSRVSYIYSNGRNGFLNDIVNLLGHQNILKTSIPYPKISTEAIMALNPDIILDLVPDTDMPEITKLIDDWEFFKNTEAWKYERIYIITGSHTTVPGPRIFDFIKDLKEKGL